MTASVEIWGDECACGHLATTHAGNGGPCCAPTCTCVRFDPHDDGLEEVPVSDDMGPEAAGASSISPAGGRRPRGEAQRLVLVALADGLQSPAAIAERLSVEQKRAATVLVKVVSKGLAEKVSYGVYEITAAGREALATGRGLDVSRDRNGSGREPQEPVGQEVETDACTSGRNRDDAPPAPSRNGNTSAPSAHVEPADEEPSRPDDPTERSARDPLRTADIPYDADILDDEADFLIRRAAALRQIASGIRVLAEGRTA